MARKKLSIKAAMKMVGKDRAIRDLCVNLRNASRSTSIDYGPTGAGQWKQRWDVANAMLCDRLNEMGIEKDMMHKGYWSYFTASLCGKFGAA